MNRNRTETLRDLLNHLRNTEMMRVRQLRHDQEEEGLSDPGDDMEVARAQTETELHASLIERSEQRLRAIDSAFNRLGSGDYGICEECGEEIPPQRLKLLPFVLFCVDCQNKFERSRGTARPARRLLNGGKAATRAPIRRARRVWPTSTPTIHRSSPALSSSTMTSRLNRRHSRAARGVRARAPG